MCNLRGANLYKQIFWGKSSQSSNNSVDKFLSCHWFWINIKIGDSVPIIVFFTLKTTLQNVFLFRFLFSWKKSKRFKQEFPKIRWPASSQHNKSFWLSRIVFRGAILCQCWKLGTIRKKLNKEEIPLNFFSQWIPMKTLSAVFSCLEWHLIIFGF